MDAIPMPNGPNLFMADNNYVANTGHMLKVEWEASDTLTFRSISAYRDLDSTTHQVLNSGNTDVISGFAINYPSLPQYPVTRAYSPLVPAIATAGLSYGAQNHITRDKYLSQEFALLGRPSEFFKYTAGFYYFDEKGNSRATQGEQMVLNSFGSPFSAIPGQGPISLISLANGTNASAHNSSWAVFGQFSWRPDILERRLEITPGVRYTRDRREATLQNNGATTYFYAPSGLTVGAAGALFRGATQAVPAGYIVVPGTAIVPASAGESTFSRTTPSLTLSYQLDEHQMVYGKVVKGYRSGGFHAASSSAAFFTQGYAPETLTSTELGFKGEFFGRRLRSNFAVFQSKYSDQQITISKRYISTSTSDVVNAGKSTYKGFELDLTAALTDALRLNFNYAQVKFDYNRIIDQGADVTDFYHFLPAEVSYSVGANYSFGKVGPGKLDWNLGYAYTDKSHTNVADIYTVAGGVATLAQRVDTENSTTPAFGLWNTRLAMSGIPVGPGNQGDITVGLWIKNVANRKSPGFVVDPGVGTMVGAVSPFLPPRTYGVDLIYRY